MGRLSEPGPKPGTCVITIEVPKELDDERAYAVYVAIDAILQRTIPGAFTHWYKVMENRGKHGSNGDG